MRKTISQFIARFTKTWGFFEYSVAAGVLLAVVAALYILSAHKEAVEVEVRLGVRDLIYNDFGAPQAVDTHFYQPGMQGKDVFGRWESEIVKVSGYTLPQTTTLYGQKQSSYVTLKVNASYDARRDIYKFKGTNLEMGDWVRIEVGPVAVEGVISNINGKYRVTDKKTITVKAQLKTEDPREGSSFVNVTGVDRYVADAITVGEVMKDASGDVLATVLEKTVVPAHTVTADLYGNLYDRQNPRKVDVTLTLKLSVRDIGNQTYFLEGLPVKVNSRLPLFLDTIDIEPRVTEIVTSP
jgi:C4-type Zn-finger protein